LNLVKA